MAMLQVDNLTRSQVLVTHGRVAVNPWTRLKGLIGVRDLPVGDGLLIKPCNGIHCMFMSIPIDVLYMDRDDRIVALDVAMAPWHMGHIHGRSAYVIELPAGTVAATATAVGDQLAVRY
jgi:uncharacterized membrane protein (UPF0127 family)